MNAHRTVPLALLAAATAVLATACASTTTAGAAGTTPGAAVTSAAATSAAASPSAASQPVKARPVASRSAAAPGAGNADSDSYAWKHPCDPGQVTVEVRYQHSVGDSRRVIVATNHGSAACGLSYYPTVMVTDSRTVGPNSHPTGFVTPKVPGGLGGAPYTPVHAGQSLYAVLDLDPSGSTAGASRGYDELDVKAAEFMPDAATTNHPVKAQPSGTGNPYVKSPLLSLYQPSIADAVKQVSDPGNFR